MIWIFGGSLLLLCRPKCLNYDDGMMIIFTCFSNEIISMEHHYKFHHFSFEPLLARTFQLQSIIELFASYIVTLSKLTNGKFLHNPLNLSMLCIPLLLRTF